MMDNTSYDVTEPLEDERKENEFKGIVFTGNKLVDAKKALMTSILANELEAANYWCANMIASLHFLEIWELYLELTTMYICTSNMKMPMYLCLKYANFAEYMNNNRRFREIDVRNEDQIRVIFAEMTSVMCLSPKNKTPVFSQIKILPHEFTPQNVAEKRRSPSAYFIDHFLKPDDDAPLRVPANELIYQLSQCDFNRACYWIQWILSFPAFCKKNFLQPCKCSRRIHYITDAPDLGVSSTEEKLSREPVWLLFDILSYYLFQYEEERPLYEKLYNDLLTLFKKKMSATTITKRWHVLYFITLVICNRTHIDPSIPLVNDTNMLTYAMKNRELCYRKLRQDCVIDNSAALIFGIDGGGGDANKIESGK